MSQSQVERLREIMARLRAPDGCPWDREQTHQTLAPYLIEECCELLDALDRADLAHMQEELGDVLLQVVFHAQLAEEAGHFNLEDVARTVADKLVRRHPHVFGDNRLQTSEQVLRQWEQIKAAEKPSGDSRPQRVMKELPPTLPALRRAYDTYRELAKKQALPKDPALFDMTNANQLASQADASELGRRLFELAAACRIAGLDPETILRQHVLKVVDAAEREHTAH